MTKIVIEELNASLEQGFTALERINVEAIRPLLYKHRSPAGSIFIEIEQNSVVIATSTAVTSAIIEANSDSTTINFTHGAWRFDFGANINIEEGDFIIRMTSSGYTFTDSAYFGWHKPHDNITITIDYDTSQLQDEGNPFGLEIWGRSGKMTRELDISDTFTAATEPTIEFANPTVTGTFASPSQIVAGTGIVISDATIEIIIVEGSGGPVDISVDPQIPVATVEGSQLILIGASDTNTVQLDDGTGLSLTGTMTLFDESNITLTFRDGLWNETSRKN